MQKMYFIKICLSLALVLLGVSGAVLPVVFGEIEQFLQLYEEFDILGEYIDVTEYEPDLDRLGFDNRTRSACMLGNWNFYTEPNYSYRNGNGAVYSHSTSSTNPSCFNLYQNMAGKVSSVRFAGSPGFPDNIFYLYEYRGWMGEEEVFTDDQPNLRLTGRHNSIIITGNSSWSVFEGTNYTGRRICLVPFGRRLSIYDISREGMQEGSLRSARKGCDVDSSLFVLVNETQININNGKIIRYTNIK